MAALAAVAAALPFGPRAALAQAQANTEIVCEVAAYDIYVRNDGTMTVAAESILRWYVPFTREQGFHTLRSPLEPGRTALISGVLNVAILEGAPCEAVVFDLGEPREDLDRFHGLYGDPANDNAPRFVVGQALNNAIGPQPGFLMISSAGAAAWYMRSVADTRFEQWVPADGDSVVVAFETDADGAAVALVFETVLTDLGRLERLGDAP
ncbi:MAG: hypothetical protein KIT43_10670 [Bauldia sp.]|nr:hypothetical protein [Bauldia sp.]